MTLQCHVLILHTLPRTSRKHGLHVMLLKLKLDVMPCSIFSISGVHLVLLEQHVMWYLNSPRTQKTCVTVKGYWVQFNAISFRVFKCLPRTLEVICITWKKKQQVTLHYSSTLAKMWLSKSKATGQPIHKSTCKVVEPVHCPRAITDDMVRITSFNFDTETLQCIWELWAVRHGLYNVWQATWNISLPLLHALKPFQTFHL